MACFDSLIYEIIEQSVFEISNILFPNLVDGGILNRFSYSLFIIVSATSIIFSYIKTAKSVSPFSDLRRATISSDNSFTALSNSVYLLLEYKAHNHKNKAILMHLKYLSCNFF